MASQDRRLSEDVNSDWHAHSRLPPFAANYSTKLLAGAHEFPSALPAAKGAKMVVTPLLGSCLCFLYLHPCTEHGSELAQKNSTGPDEMYIVTRLWDGACHVNNGHMGGCQMVQAHYQRTGDPVIVSPSAGTRAERTTLECCCKHTMWSVSFSESVYTAESTAYGRIYGPRAVFT